MQGPRRAAFPPARPQGPPPGRSPAPTPARDRRPARPAAACGVDTPRPAPSDAPAPLSSTARTPRARLRQRRAYPEPHGCPPRRSGGCGGKAYAGALAPGAPPLRARRPPGAPGASRGLTGAGPARRSSGPSSDGKWRALLLLLMDGGATPATRGVSRNYFQGPLLHPLRSSRSGQAAGGTYQTWEAGRAFPRGDQ